MTPGPEDEVSQAEKRSVMRREAELRSGDLGRYAPELAAGRPPELSEQQKEKLRLKLAEQQKASTFHQHAQAMAGDELGGRFKKTMPTTVTGAAPDPWPKLPSSSPWSGKDPVGSFEPSFGIAVSIVREKK
jgi:hypothetical protein